MTASAITIRRARREDVGKIVAMLADATGDLFNRSCCNFPTLGDLYKIATYDAYQKRGLPVPPPAAGD